MLTSSVSSPMGPGSNSEVVPIRFGDLDSYLVDSSQFGFEPILMNDIEKVYCYLPSMRGENPDKRHLNQFFHCEAEIKGDLSTLISIVEQYVVSLCSALDSMPNLVSRISRNPEATQNMLSRVCSLSSFRQITFDDAVTIFKKSTLPGLFIETDTGVDITSIGELELMRILETNVPLWVTSYDRDRVPFYLKPDPKNINKVINADLIFPSLDEGSFGGEIVGCGQRQDSPEEIYESLNRQNISTLPYEWYINLRRLPRYSTTSGFGLGIERFITWALCGDDIKDSIVYPRLKNVQTLP